ncbi:MAG: flagellin [Methanospirillum sp.]|uniref:flagellin n=1 Tax=Methanospirillum sp. TaxID=45200 RepID=UPI002371ACEB|nr:flagellin [Methanospirillum sp.]MDD1729528.1 flagellin [Methanospirillum sp.]
MSGEAISSSILLIGAAVGAAFLIAAILPAIFSAGDTFGTVAHSADSKMKTDFRIVNTYASTSPNVTVWMKNVGANRLSIYDIQKSDIFYTKNTGQVTSLTYPDGFGYALTDSSNNGYWDIGETLQVSVKSPTITDGDQIYFSFTTPNGVRRTTTFSTNV